MSESNTYILKTTIDYSAMEMPGDFFSFTNRTLVGLKTATNRERSTVLPNVVLAGRASGAK